VGGLFAFQVSVSMERICAPVPLNSARKPGGF
jgi:hypothetical protein